MFTLNCIYKGLRKFWACKVVVILLVCLLANELRYYWILFDMLSLRILFSVRKILIKSIFCPWCIASFSRSDFFPNRNAYGDQDLRTFIIKITMLQYILNPNVFYECYPNLIETSLDEHVPLFGYFFHNYENLPPVSLKLIANHNQINQE